MIPIVLAKEIENINTFLKDNDIKVIKSPYSFKSLDAAEKYLMTVVDYVKTFVKDQWLKFLDYMLSIKDRIVHFLKSLYNYIKLLVKGDFGKIRYINGCFRISMKNGSCSIQAQSILEKNDLFATFETGLRPI